MIAATFLVFIYIAVGEVSELDERNLTGVVTNGSICDQFIAQHVGEDVVSKKMMTKGPPTHSHYP